MKITIDTDTALLTVLQEESEQVWPLYSKQAFEILSRQWVRVGWAEKYQYTFSWFGRPVIQLPEDMLRIQEVIYRLKPDVIIETGVAHGGSLVFYASLMQAMNHGHVIGIDIEIRPHNRAAIEAHELFSRITLIEGSSTDSEVVAKAASLVKPTDNVLVILDSNHSYAHVLNELRAYAPLVTAGSYIVATDGIMHDLADVPRGHQSWLTDNPTCAARDFADAHPEFVIEQPHWSFNESNLEQNVTHWPGAWLKRC
ncbi:cephalosporin hydroxylase family protein [Rheinheimera marina]|uniref:Cephalosporin hydroxylase family protein n=1 Tax=Rheinheimera marina TaxID=1774958 RepID=A0ABV9JRR8_9GAMM